MVNKQTITTLGNKVHIVVTPDKSLYYSTLSKDWAISNTIVDNEDYSSKYYASESKMHAESAEKQATIAEGKTSEVVNQGNEVLAKITENKNSAINSINIAKSAAVNSINTAKTEAVNTINSIKTTAVNACAEQVTLAKEYAQMANGWYFSYDEENEMLVFVEHV